MLAAAAALGCTRLYGSDLREDFARQAESNLAATGLVRGGSGDVQGGGEGLDVFAHDATRPLPSRVVVDLVVSNPPWGKNFGQVAEP